MLETPENKLRENSEHDCPPDLEQTKLHVSPESREAIEKWKKGQDDLKNQEEQKRRNTLKDARAELDKKFAESEDSNVCPSCGTLIKKGARFCGQCGTNLATGETLEQTKNNERVEKICEPFFADSQNNQNETFIEPSEDGLHAKIKAVVVANGLESAGFSAGSFASIEADGQLGNFTGKDGSISNLIKCDNVKLKIGGEEINFDDICPGDADFFLADIGQGKATYTCTTTEKEITDQRIFLREFSSPDDVVAILHEIGHLVDNHKKDKREIIKSKCAFTFQSLAQPEKETIEAIRFRAGGERNAWAQAIKIARRYKLPIIDNIRNYAQSQDALGSYQKAVDEIYKVDVGVTNQKRKELRRLGKKP